MATEHDDATDDPAGLSLVPLVGIGASAGGLEALELLVARLRPTQTSYVVVQHLAPKHESFLAEILQRNASLKVVTIADALAIEPGTIYVAPPDCTVAFADGAFHLEPQSASAIPAHGIDAFFRALAARGGTASIAVVLSGASSDGTAGARVIKEDGGIVLAQSPESAAQPRMPQSVIESGSADFVLSPAEIGDELMRLAAHPFVSARAARTLDHAAFAQIYERLRRAYGVDFASYKLGTIERRIQRRLALHKVTRIEDYLALLDARDGELAVLYSDLLIGVTGFFRDQEPFESLKTLVFPRLLADRGREEQLRIWVAGCSTGEEAYSIAMEWLEFLDEHPRGPDIQIFATDLDERALTRARIGIYTKGVELDVSPARLQRFFTKENVGYQVSRQLRDMVLFARHDLASDPPFSHVDLVSCRNVLIYLQPPLQRKLLRIFHYALNPSAFLLLGASESVGACADLFVPVDRRTKIFAKQNVPSTLVFDATVALPATPAARPPPTSFERRQVVTMQQLADRKVLDRYAPPGILVDENLDVIQFRGDMAPYLSPTPGTATLNAAKLLRPELNGELRAASNAALSDLRPITTARVEVFRDGTHRPVVMEVIPIHDLAAKRKCLLVMFHENNLEAAKVAHPPPRAREPRVEELERELTSTKEFLQTTIQELEATNEELQTANEELQSSNEELQSTNEELQTSKEESQSINEELATINDELQHRVSELTLVNDDVRNILGELSVSLVLVGADKRLRRFSRAAELLLHLGPEDEGRPVAHLGASLGVADLEVAVAAAMDSMRESAQRVHAPDGSWYTLRLVPYRTSDRAVRGVVLELARAPALTAVDGATRVDELVGRVLSMLPHVLMLLDDQLRLVWVNKAFFTAFVAGAEVLGRKLDDIWAGGASHPELWTALEQAVAQARPFGPLVVEHPFARKTDRAMTFSAQCLPPEGTRGAMTLVVMEEIDDKSNALSH